MVGPDGPAPVEGEGLGDGPVRLIAFVKRREGTTREEFLEHWRDRHGPLIRDTPGLARHIERYEQMAARPGDRSGWDGVAVQQFRSWSDFVGLLSDPAAAAMRADEEAFLDPASTKVVFTADRVVVIGDDALTSDVEMTLDEPVTPLAELSPEGGREPRERSR